MASFRRTNTKIYTKTGPEFTPDNVYWKKYTAPVLVKEYGAIDYIDFSPTEPHYFAVTCSVRVQLYNSITKVVTKKISKFQDAAYGGSFRKDGRLLCAGGNEPVVTLFDVERKKGPARMLRLFSGHKAAVHRTFFSTDGSQIVSFSDDKTTALWDIVSESQILNFEEHSDYVRAGAMSPVSNDIFISGSYDKTVNMYDVRTKKKICTVNHDAPVESVIFLPSGGIFLSAGGTEIRVWDALTGGKLLAKMCNHHKTITCLRIASNGHRILSGSLDRHVKVYDSGTYKTVHTLDYPNSVLSIGISGDDETIVTGMVDGMISIRRKEAEEKKEIEPSRKKKSYRYSSRNLHSVDVVVESGSKEKMSKHDTWLRKFAYSKALDSVLLNYVVNKTPHVTVALMQELIRRQGLHQALAGRNDKSLVSILKFLIKWIGSVRFGRVLLFVANVFMDIYEDEVDNRGMEVRTMFGLLAKKLDEEQQLILNLTELQGALQMILSSAESTPVVALKNLPALEPSENANKNIVFKIN